MNTRSLFALAVLLLTCAGCGRPTDPTAGQDNNRSTEIVARDQWVADVEIDGQDVAEISALEWRVGEHRTITTKLTDPKRLADLGPGDKLHRVVFYAASPDHEFDGSGDPGLQFGAVLIREDGIQDKDRQVLSPRMTPGEYKAYVCYNALNMTMVTDDVIILSTFSLNVLPPD